YKRMASMSWQFLFPVIVSILLAVFGWVVGHKLTSQRDIRNKQRELRVKYLLEAYEVLMVLGRNGKILLNYKEVERAVFIIEVFGTKEQIELTRRFTKEMAENSNSNFTELVVCIRDYIRDELGLDNIGEGINMLRIEPMSSEL
ncbi:hypothetical protein ACPFUQ_003704, partial [Vibrio cholerae]